MSLRLHHAKLWRLRPFYQLLDSDSEEYAGLVYSELCLSIKVMSFSKNYLIQSLLILINVIWRLSKILIDWERDQGFCRVNTQSLIRLAKLIQQPKNYSAQSDYWAGLNHLATIHEMDWILMTDLIRFWMS